MHLYGMFFPLEIDGYNLQFSVELVPAGESAFWLIICLFAVFGYFRLHYNYVVYKKLAPNMVLAIYAAFLSRCHGFFGKFLFWPAQ